MRKIRAAEAESEDIFQNKWHWALAVTLVEMETFSTASLAPPTRLQPANRNAVVHHSPGLADRREAYPRQLYHTYANEVT
jgi:hypothetical protein